MYMCRGRKWPCINAPGPAPTGTPGDPANSQIRDCLDSPTVLQWKSGGMREQPPPRRRDTPARSPRQDRKRKKNDTQEPESFGSRSSEEADTTGKGERAHTRNNGQEPQGNGRGDRSRSSRGTGAGRHRTGARAANGRSGSDDGAHRPHRSRTEGAARLRAVLQHQQRQNSGPQTLPLRLRPISRRQEKRILPRARRESQSCGQPTRTQTLPVRMQGSDQGRQLDPRTRRQIPRSTAQGREGSRDNSSIRSKRASQFNGRPVPP